MRKTWKLHNGWDKLNAEGLDELCVIGPADFDPNFDADADAEDPTHYRRDRDGSYVFTRKRDYVAAVARLREQGYRS